MILGLDASSSCIGWSLLDDQENLIDFGYLDLKPFDDLYLKLEFFREFLLEFEKKYSIDSLKIYIEEPLMMFGKGKSMAQVISKLQRWNGMISAVIYSDFEIKPILINASHARKLCGVKINRDSKAKEQVMEFVKNKNIIPEDKWDKKKTGKLKDYVYDICDAYIVALAGSKDEQ